MSILSIASPSANGANFTDLIRKLRPPFRGDFAMQLEIISIFLSVFCYKNQMNYQQILIVLFMLINNFEETDKLPIAAEEEMTYGKK